MAAIDSDPRSEQRAARLHAQSLVTRSLVTRGYSDAEIAGFLGGNFLRVFEQAVG